MNLQDWLALAGVPALVASTASFYFSLRTNRQAARLGLEAKEREAKLDFKLRRMEEALAGRRNALKQEIDVARATDEALQALKDELSNLVASVSHGALLDSRSVLDGLEQAQKKLNQAHGAARSVLPRVTPDPVHNAKAEGINVVAELKKLLQETHHIPAFDPAVLARIEAARATLSDGQLYLHGLQMRSQDAIAEALADAVNSLA